MIDRIGHFSGRSRGLVRLPGTHRRPVIAAVAAVTLVIATLASVSATTTTAASAAGRAAYLDSAAPVQARVADLLGRMTLAEKIGQMVQIEATQVTDTSNNCTSQGGFNMPNPNPNAQGGASLLFKVTDRAILSYTNAKRLAMSLTQLIKRYEQQFGEIPVQGGPRR